MAAAQSWSLVAWLPANSLPRYVPDDHTFNVDRLTREVGAHGSRHHVAAIKHVGDVDSWPRPEWAERLCCNDCFVEGIVVDDLLPTQVERFLAEGGTWKEMLRANAAVLAGSATDEQRAKASQYSTLKKLMNAQNMTIAWEQV